MNESLHGGVGKAQIKLRTQDFPIKEFVCQHDPLYIRALFLQAKTEFLLLSLELTSLTESMVYDLKASVYEEFNIPIENIWITVTHTFSAPHLDKSYPIFIKKVKEAVQLSVSRALERVTKLAISTDSVTTSLNCSRNIETPFGWWLGRNDLEYSNHDIRILKIYEIKTDHLLCVLFNGDLPPSVMADSYLEQGGKAVSSDLIGYTCRKLEETVTQTAIFILGAAGDQRPLEKSCEDIVSEECLKRNDLHEAGFKLVETQGDRLYEEICSSLVKPNPIFLPIKAISIYEKKVFLEEKVMPIPTKELKPTKHFDFSKTGRQQELTIAGVSLGSIVLLGIKPEVNSLFGEKLRELVNVQTVFIASMVNGAIKYLPEEKDFERVTYTAMNTQLGRGSSKQFLEEVRRFLKESNLSVDKQIN